MRLYSPGGSVLFYSPHVTEGMQFETPEKVEIFRQKHLAPWINVVMATFGDHRKLWQTDPEHIQEGFHCGNWRDGFNFYQ